jgi:hypothetical protein
MPLEYQKADVKYWNYLEVCSRVPLLCVNKQREEQRVPYEEDGCVVTYQVPYTIICVELDCKASRIPSQT